MNHAASDFESKIKEILPEIKIIGPFKGNKIKILVEDGLGIQYEVYPEALKRGNYPKITSALDITDAFNRKLKQKHPELTLVSDYVGANEYVKVQDELGIRYQVTPGSLLHSPSKPSIKSAIDKTEALKKMVYSKRSDCEIIGEYQGDKCNVLLKDKYGILHKMLPYNILKGNGLSLKSAVDKTDYIRIKMLLTHPELKLVGEYNGAFDKIEVEDNLGIRYSILFNAIIKSNRAISLKSAIDRNLAVSKVINSLRNDITEISNYNSAKENLIVKDDYGFEHSMLLYGLIDGNSLGFNSVIDKTDYFDFFFNKINKLGYKRLGKYTRHSDLIKMICPQHGEFNSTPEKLLSGSLCDSCYKESRVNTLEYFIEKASLIHQNKYDYSKSVYIGFNSRIDIICPKHGLFNQLVKGHLSGKGCKMCAQESRTGTLASVSKYNPTFNYKIYKFLVWSDDRKELFGKVGLTLDVKRRIWGIPYNVEVLEVKEGSISNLFKEEQEFFSKIKSEGLQYTPKLKFGGYTECYKLTDQELEKYKFLIESKLDIK